MRLSILPVLRCPVSGARLLLEPSRVEGDHVMEGALRAEGRSETYPITGGVPRLLPAPDVGRHTRATFGFQWARRVAGLEPEHVCYGFSVPETIDFFERTILPEPFDDDAWVLDAGCGSAEKSAEIARRGQSVIAFDLSDSVDAAFARFPDVARLHLLQADVLHPPIAPGTMRAVICTGVLHHTPDPRAGFRALSGLQTPDGRLVVWLYPRDRRSADRFLGILYRLRDGLRATHRLGAHGAYVLSLVASAGLYPFFHRRFRDVRSGERVRAREVWGAIVFNTYDFLSPRYQSRHTPEEVAEWFESEGYGSPERFGTGLFLAAKRAPAQPALSNSTGEGCAVPSGRSPTQLAQQR
jgi:SAM-dependent methyltransferase